MDNPDIPSAILSFAEKHLAPFEVKEKYGGRSEIIPEYCPFCKGGANGDKKTFALSIDKGIYVCKRGSCGKRGHFSELVEYFGEKSDIQFPKSFRSKKKETYKLPDTELFPPTDAIYQYFEGRHISRETVDAFSIKSDSKGMIVFPFYENGQRVFEKFRRPWKPTGSETSMKEWRYPGAKPILFGMDMCAFSQDLIITEGQIDAMSLYEAGIHNVVSVPSGCEDLSWVETCYDWLEKFQKIILFGDNDEPGQRMVQTLVKRLDESRCFLIEGYPKRPDGTECKDANEILYFCGEFELIDMVENAKPIPVKGLIDLGTVIPIDPTMVPRIKTNIPELDACLGGLAEGSVTVFTGKAGDGKSTLTGQLLLNGIEQGLNVCAYSGELSSERFQNWINYQLAGSDYIGLKYDPVKGKQVPFIPFNIQQRLAQYYLGRLFLFDNKEIFESNQAESILKVFTLAARRHDCKLFLVDNMMTSLSDAEEETRAQGKFVNSLKKFATRYKVHVLIVAHPRKTKVGEAIRKDDVGGNSAIVNLADSAVVVERPNLRIIKNREGGLQKVIQCCYCPDSRRIYQNGGGDLNNFSWNKEGLVPPSPLASSLPEYQEQLPPEEYPI